MEVNSTIGFGYDEYLQMFSSLSFSRQEFFTNAVIYKTLSSDQLRRYQNLLQIVVNETLDRALTVYQLVCNSASNFEIALDQCLLLRGSYAKGVPTLCSDIDLLLVYQSIKPRNYNELLRAVTCNTNCYSVLYNCDVQLNDYHRSSFGSLISILSAIPIAGNYSYWQGIKRNILSYLRSIPIERVIGLFQRDKYNRSPRWYFNEEDLSIKEGDGGIFDVEAAFLLLALALMSDRLLPNEAERYCINFNAYYWYNVVSKFVLEKISSTPIEVRHSSMQSKLKKVGYDDLILGEVSSEILRGCDQEVIKLISSLT